MNGYVGVMCKVVRNSVPLMGIDLRLTSHHANYLTTIHQLAMLNAHQTLLVMK